MKLRLWVFGAVLVFLGLTFFSSEGSVSQVAQTPNLTKPVIMWEPDNPIQKSKGQLLGIIENLQKQIDAIPSKGPLSPPMISQIAELYGQNGNFTAHDGWTLRGNREIRLYFSRLLDCHKVTDFRIEIKFVYAKEFTDTVKKLTGTLEDISHSVYFILCNSFVLDGQLVRVPGSLSCAHQYPCPCKPNN
jgi:hypothetical protein